MPVPKRKTSKARRDKRSANKHIRPQAIAGCLNCSHPIGGHQACAMCGFYKGKKVLTTKLERAIKRGEARQSMQAQQQAAEEPAHEHSEK